MRILRLINMTGNSRKLTALLVVLMFFGTIPAFPAGADMEPNNDFAGAESISSGTYYGFIDGANDTNDYYVLNLQPGQLVNVTLTLPPKEAILGDGPLGIYLIDNATKTQIKGKSVMPVSMMNVSGSLEYTFNSEARNSRVYILVSADAVASIYTLNVRASNQQDGGSQGDAGDDFPQSKTISVGTFTGWLADQDTSDYYCITLNAGQTLFANLTIPAANLMFQPGQMSLYIYNTAQSNIANDYIDSSNFPNGGTISIHYTIGSQSPTAIYYILVYSYGAQGKYNLKIGTANQNEAGRTDYDAPESVRYAPSVPMGKYQGLLSDDDSADYYEINVTGGSGLLVMLTVPPSTDQDYTGSFTVQLWSTSTVSNESMNIGQPEIGSPSASKYFGYAFSAAQAVFTQWVSVSFSGSGSIFGPYELNMSTLSQNDMNTTRDGGEALSTATLLDVPEAGLTGTGFTGDMDTTDYYRIVSHAGDTVTANLTLPGKDDMFKGGIVYITLFDYMASEKASKWADNSVSTTPTSAIVDWTSSSDLKNTTMYIKVCSNGYVKGNYSLQIILASQNEGGIKYRDAGSSVSDAAPLTAGDFKGLLKDMDTKDYYVISLPSRSIISASITVPAKDRMIHPGKLQVELRNRMNESIGTRDLDPLPTGENTTVTINHTMPYGETNFTCYVKITNDESFSEDAATEYSLSIIITPLSTDTTPPTIRVKIPDANVTYPDWDNDINVTVTATDASGVMKVMFNLNNNTWQDCYVITSMPPIEAELGDWTLNVPILQGWNCMVIRAIDNAGNSANVTVRFFKAFSGGSLPFVRITNPPKDAIGDNYNVQIEATKGESYVWYQIDNDPWEEAQVNSRNDGRFSVQLKAYDDKYPDGKHTLRVKSYYNNVETEVVETNFTISRGNGDKISILGMNIPTEFCIGGFVIFLVVVLAGGGYAAGRRSSRKKAEKEAAEKAAAERARAAQPMYPAYQQQPNYPMAPGPYGPGPGYGAQGQHPGMVQTAQPAPAQSKPLPTACADFAVEDIFLMYQDGRLIQHTTRSLKADMDVDIMTSMLKAVQDFVKESLGKGEGGELGSMEYGDNKILLSKGKHIILAVVICGTEPPALRGEIRDCMHSIEAEFSAILPAWDGDAAKLAGSKKFLTRLGAYKPEGPAAEASGKPDVTIASELEFYQGFIRLKVAVKNNAQTVITKTAFKLIYNENVLRLDRIEPAYDCKGDDILLGELDPKEKKTVAFYLDPQICTESHIDGSLTYKDGTGTLKSITMPRKLASVVCPIMFTDENINIAMLKRMIDDELDKKDSKLFAIPTGIDPRKAFELGKSAVQNHDVKLVREFFDESTGFVGEAWYYGKAKGRDDRLVITARVIAEKNILEFFAASASTLMVTGLLAELKNDLKKVTEGQRSSAKMTQVTSEDTVQAVLKTKTLLDRTMEAEGRAGESEQRKK